MAESGATPDTHQPLHDHGKERSDSENPEFDMVMSTKSSETSSERPPSLPAEVTGAGGPDAAAGISMTRTGLYGCSNSRLRHSGRIIWQRSFGNLTVGGIRHSMLTLTSTALGGGMLAVSYVMYMCGLGLGIIMLVCGAVLAYLSTVALMEISHVTGRHTYAGLFSHCAGPLAGPILDAMLFIYGNGSCVGYLVFLGDFIPDLAKLVVPGAPEFWHSRTFAIALSTVILCPLVVVKDVSALRFMAPVSILTLFYVSVVIASRTLVNYKEHRGQADYGELKFFDFNDHIFEAFAICVFAFNCHLNVVPVAGSLVRPTKARIEKVSYRVNAIQVCFYMLIACTGYTSFLGRTDQDILNCYATDDVFMAVARGFLSLTMLVAIPINMVPTVRSGLQFWSFFRPGAEPLLAPSPPGSPPGSPRSGSSGGTPIPMQEGPACPRICLALVCVIVQALLAIQIPGVADVLGLLGASVATLMMLMIPAYCMGKVLPRTAKSVAKQILLCFFSLVSFASIPVKILRATKVLGT
mmetsp:Transcript_127382/g.220830  ORF Transcript_127382/g.220830 Transcript_127382/m.220830 type:complete len:524 (-) Transcript_127382:125-1696(-)